MAETKYGRYVIKAPLRKAANDEVIEPIVHFIGERDGGGASLTVSRSWITQPLTMIKEPHQHDHDQVLFLWAATLWMWRILELKPRYC